MSSLVIHDLHAGYSGQPVLKGITLDTSGVGTTAIIGPNGHGKTTLLRTISGLVRPASGEITLDGTRLDQLPAHAVAAAGVCHIPQGDLVFTSMNVEDNLLMGAYLMRDREVISNHLDKVYEFLPRLKDRRSQSASTLSGGERRMLGIGRGLMMDGQILLVDEPSLGLAPIVIEQIYEVLEALKDAGQSIILVEENASRVLDFAEQILLIDSGTIKWHGNSEEAVASQELLSAYLGD